MNKDSKQPPVSSSPPAPPATPPRPLRIWPAVLLLAGMLVTRFVPQMLDDGPAWIWMAAAFGPLLGCILIVLWWVAGSRATWRERIVGTVGLILAFGATWLLIDPSMKGPGIMVMTIPMGIAAFAIGAILFRRRSPFQRTMVALLLATLGFGYSTLVRNSGLWGNFAMGLHWRWEPSSDEQLLSDTAIRPAAGLEMADVEAALAQPLWTGFRGPNRDSRQHGTNLATDWDASPPELLWKIVVGPGWSSFAVAGNLLFTQEQRGNEETVVCYDGNTGRQQWARSFEARFDDPLGGPGPRATPTLAEGGLFVMGATGILARLIPATGEVVWQQDLREVAGRQPPMWGFASSPLVVDSLAIVFAGGEGDKGTLAFDTATGELKWSAPGGTHSYSSPQLGQLLDEPYVLILSEAGLDLLEPQTGAVRLHYDWPIAGYRSVQPQVLGADTVVVPSDVGEGTQRIRVVQTADGLQAEEMWTSRNLKPDFNDFVIHDGSAYGFDVQLFTSIDLETGHRNWKGGRYGKGQVLSVEDSGLLLVMGEQGEVVLVKADPARHVELARFQALEGKTWNHPVLVGDRLYVRNSQEAAAYRLPLAGE